MADPTSATRTGGGRYAAFFTLGVDGSVGASPVFTLDRILGASMPRNAENSGIDPSIKTDQDDDNMRTFIRTYGIAPSQGGGEVKYNDGFTEGGSTGEGDPLLMIYYGAPSNKSGDNLRKIWIIPGQLSPESGSSSEDPDTRTQPSIEFKSRAVNAMITVDSSRVRSDLVTTSGMTAMVLNTNERGGWFFRAKA